MMNRHSSLYPVLPIGSLLDLGMQSPIRAWHRVHAPPRGPVAPLRAGAAALASFGLQDSWPASQEPATPAMVLSLHSARVHASAGIVVTEDGQALAETLSGTHPEHHGYRLEADAKLVLPPPTSRLRGTWVSLLLPGPYDIYRVLTLSLGRLSLLTPAQITSLDGVLLPAGLGRKEREAAATLLHYAFGPHGMPDHVQVRLVGPSEGLDVERVLLPWGVGDGEWIHPAAAAFLRPLALPGAPERGRGRSIYIDRRRQMARPLSNEDEVLDALSRLGVEPVVLEELAFKECIALASQSELIVGATDPTLACLVFSAPGASVLEIRPHLQAGWRYRALSAASAVNYDCVLSRSVRQGGGFDDADLISVVSVETLAGAVADILARR